MNIKNFATFEDCLKIKERYLEVYDYNFDHVDYFSQLIGSLWIYYRATVQSYEGTYYNRNLSPIFYMRDSNKSLNMNSNLIYDFNTGYNPNILEYVTNVTLSAENTDGTIYILADSSNPIQILGNLEVVEFYLCGCSSEESKCGTCCINCCDIARDIIEYQENILL